MSDLKDQGLLKVGGSELEYRMIGPRPGDAPTIVLLHEGLGCVGMWRDFPDRLAEATGRGVFVYSRQGYGGSSPCAVPRPLTYMQEEGREVLPLVLEAMGFQQGTLFGHSDGASIAAVYAGTHEDPRVENLVLMAPHFFTEKITVASIAEAKTAYETTQLRERLKRYHGDNVDCAFWGWNGAWLDPGFLEWNLEEFLPGIRQPVLALQGEDDQYGTARQVEVVAEKAGGPVELVLLSDCKHAPFKEQTEATLAAVSRFLEGPGKTMAAEPAAANIREGR